MMKLFDDYVFQTDEYKKRWQSVLDNRFEYMYYTNFSPTRVELLKREVRISNSEEQIMKLY